MFSQLFVQKISQIFEGESNNRIREIINTLHELGFYSESDLKSDRFTNRIRDLSISQMSDSGLNFLDSLKILKFVSQKTNLSNHCNQCGNIFKNEKQCDEIKFGGTCTGIKMKCKRCGCIKNCTICTKRYMKNHKKRETIMISKL
jgi:hypothetical protein